MSPAERDASEKQVLIVEDETLLRTSMVRGIAKLPGVVVRGAGTIAEATRAIAARPPDLLVADLDLPDGTGLELISLLDERSLEVPILFVSGYVSTYQRRIPSRMNIEVHEKPLALERLRELVQQRLAPRAAPAVATGAAPDATEDAPFSALDYIQVSCMGRHSVLLRMEREGIEAGEIHIVDGELWSARDATGLGYDALKRLVFSTTQRVSCRSSKAPEVERNLNGGWEQILLDAAREMDEAEREQQSAPATAPRGARSPRLTAVHAVVGAPAMPPEDAWSLGGDELLSQEPDGATIPVQAGATPPPRRSATPPPAPPPAPSAPPATARAPAPSRPGPPPPPAITARATAKGDAPRLPPPLPPTPPLPTPAPLPAEPPFSALAASAGRTARVARPTAAQRVRARRRRRLWIVLALLVPALLLLLAFVGWRDARWRPGAFRPVPPQTGYAISVGSMAELYAAVPRRTRKGMRVTWQLLGTAYPKQPLLGGLPAGDHELRAIFYESNRSIVRRLVIRQGARTPLHLEGP
ncbi:MAG: response regulator [Proteobacteria bacterium]|nr:response regulator [Pseudomonadota bacterium]